MSVVAPLPASWQPMCQLHLTMSWCNRTTGSDVVATAVTTLMVAPPPSSSKTLAPGRMTKAAALPYRSAGPQLPHSLSHAKRCELLIQERDAFMQSLNTERAARAKAEAWASTRIQSVWRGFWIRLPRLRARAAIRAARVHAASIETDTPAQLRAELARLKAATDARLSAEAKEAEEELPQWKRELREREAAKVARKHQRALQIAATLRIQKVIRGFLARRAMRIVRLLRGQQRGPIAITRLQAIVRGFIVRTKRAAARSKVHYDAALKIQLAIRRYLAKTRVADLRLQLKTSGVKHASATSIQAVWRRHNSQKDFRLRVEAVAAKKIQAVLRGASVRKLRLEETRAQQAAAVRIQSLMRQHQAVEVVQEKRAVAKKEQFFASRKARRAKAEATAVVMQSAYRGFVGRKRAKVLVQERLVHASIAIQAAARGMIARNVAASLREQRTRDKSAIRIQAALRGLFGKRRVQAIRLDRQESIRLEAAAAEERAQKLREEEAAARRADELIRKHAAALAIQRVIRGFLARARVSKFRLQRLKELEDEAMSGAPRRRVRRGASKMSDASSQG